MTLKNTKTNIPQSIQIKKVRDSRSCTTSSWYRWSMWDLSSYIEQMSAEKHLEDRFEAKKTSIRAHANPQTQFRMNMQRKIRSNGSGSLRCKRWLAFFVTMICICQCNATCSSHHLSQNDVASAWPLIMHHANLPSATVSWCNLSCALTCQGWTKSEFENSFACCHERDRQTEHSSRTSNKAPAGAACRPKWQIEFWKFLQHFSPISFMWLLHSRFFSIFFCIAQKSVNGRSARNSEPNTDQASSADKWGPADTLLVEDLEPSFEDTDFWEKEKGFCY